MLLNSGHQISLTEIEEVLPEHHYHFKRPVGAGGFGSVFLVHSARYNQDFCIKRIKHPISAFDETKNEATTLIKLCHPNIISMYEFFFDEARTHLYIVLEYCSGGSLKDFIEKEGPIKPPKLYSYCYQIIKALLYCHEQNVAHRDIKPANILLDNYGRPKLADFGLSRKLTKGEVVNSCAGSRPYMAPEVITRQNADPFLADIWSLGITFYTIAFGKLPWATQKIEELEMAIQVGIFNFPSCADPLFCKLIHSMTAVNPSKREPLAKLLRSPLFEGVQKYSYASLCHSSRGPENRDQVMNRRSLSVLPAAVSYNRISNRVNKFLVKKPEIKQNTMLPKTFGK
ncbi:CAMK family protein kinase [Histomonas meleagridis]|uniref:CAMK family protein kinase n=1 Tax=Histomonas meleagridis TaxID=135588 RepID=UPI00355A1687|nr:CAMK family protein kinase [Histomonas meleagridis]KAH0805168.1 CAMK family protein kinase [Histomonas meleagridis]